jgi:hypothetical protein
LIDALRNALLNTISPREPPMIRSILCRIGGKPRMAYLDNPGDGYAAAVDNCFAPGALSHASRCSTASSSAVIATACCSASGSLAVPWRRACAPGRTRSAPGLGTRLLPTSGTGTGIWTRIWGIDPPAGTSCWSGSLLVADWWT